MNSSDLLTRTQNLIQILKISGSKICLKWQSRTRGHIENSSISLV